MSSWAFVIVAYGVAVAMTLALLLWSLTSMRRAEAAANSLAQK